MYVQFHNYRHPDNEVNLTAFEVTPKWSPRNRELTQVHRMHVRGELQAVGQAALNTAIIQLLDAYSLLDMDKTFGLYHDDGTPTRHRLESSTINAHNISGVRMAYRSWPKGEPEEYVTARSYYIIMEAEYSNAESQLVDFHEIVRKVGNAGPRYRYIEYAGNRLPDRQLVNQYTVQRIIQDGYGIGFQGYIEPPGPLLPALEDQDLREVSPESPQFAGRQHVYFRSSWRYHHTAPTDQSVFPHAL